MSNPRLRTSSRLRGTPVAGIALIAVLALAGCGDSAPGDPEETDDGAAQSETAQSDAAAGEDGDGAQSADSGGSYGDGTIESFATAELADVAGTGIGTVSFKEIDSGVLIEAEVRDLQAGFRGITIHERGVCEPQSSSETGSFGDFESSGGHLLGTMDEQDGIVEGEEAPESDPTETNLDDVSAQEPSAEPEAATHPGHAGDLPNLLVNQDRTGWLSVVSDRLTPEDLLSSAGTSVIIHAAADNHANIPQRYTGLGPDAESLADGDAGSRVACGVVEER